MAYIHTTHTHIHTSKQQLAKYCLFDLCLSVISGYRCGVDVSSLRFQLRLELQHVGQVAIMSNTDPKPYNHIQITQKKSYMDWLGW